MYPTWLTEKMNSLGIEYFSVLRYTDVCETSSEILARAEIAPKTAIVYLLPYYGGECVNLSRYAASLDYHIALREINSELISTLAEHYPNSMSAGYGDHSPVDERHAALISGLGIAGDNGLIINEKYGSYVFIGDILTDIDPDELSAVAPSAISRCHSCGACKRACPTGILSGDGCDCLSAITQKKGELSDSEIALMRRYNTVWGCDECQRVCPYNKDPAVTPIDFFHRERITHLTREILDAMSRDEFCRRAFAWRGRRTVERNLDALYGEKTAEKP